MSIDTTDPSRERRLHPLSWLFVLLQQLRQFIVPLVVLVFFNSRGDRDGLWPLIGVGALVAASLWQYFTYRYRVTADSVMVSSGVFERSLRQIPFARIHNVALHQTLLHRLFGVAEVRLESASGGKPEAHMRVLRLDDATALEELVRGHARAAAVGAALDSDAVGSGSLGSHATPAGVDAAHAGDVVLLRLSTADVLRIGLVSNRGMVVVAAAAAAATQFSPRLLPNLSERAGREIFGYAGSHHFGVLQYLLALVGLALLLAALLRLFSLVLAVLRYHGFVLREANRRLTVEHGMLTRWRTSTSRRRIQAWTLHEGVVHRLLGRRTLGVDSAVLDKGHDEHALNELAPIATPTACDALVTHLLPDVAWPPREWHRLHPAAAWRMLLPWLVATVIASLALAWRVGPQGLWLLLAIAWFALSAWQQGQRAGYSLDTGVVAVRMGWWSRSWRFAPVRRLHALRLVQSPLDRAFGMAGVWMDTMGAGALGPPLRVSYLPIGEAQALYDRLRASTPG